MESKRILEKMYELIVQDSNEYINENDFNRSLLKSIKAESSQELSYILEELLIILKSGNQSIGEVSNGVFVFYPEVIRETKKTVNKKIHSTEENKEKNEKIINPQKEDEFKENIKEELDQLISKYEDATEDEYIYMFDNLDKMNDEQFSRFRKKVKEEEEFLVENGIKDQEEAEKNQRKLLLLRHSKSEDLEISAIANLVLGIESDDTSPQDKLLFKIILKSYARRKDLSDKAKKICEELDVESIIIDVVEDHTKEEIINPREYKNISKREEELYKEGKKIDRLSTETARVYVEKINRGESINANELINKFSLEGDDLIKNIDNKIETVDDLFKMIRRLDRAKRYKARMKTLDKGKEDQDVSSEESRQEHRDTKEMIEKIKNSAGKPVIKKPGRLKHKKLKAARYMDSQNSLNSISKEEYAAIPIKSYEIDDFFEEQSTLVDFESVKKNNSNNYDNYGQYKKIFERHNPQLTAESVIDTAIVNEINKKEINYFVAKNGTIKGLEDAASMLFSVGEIIQGKDEEEVDNQKTSAPSDEEKE